MAVNILLRRGTAAEWTASNPTLLEAEVGLETDSKKLKVGDGLTVWASLPYITLTPTAAASIYATIANPSFTGTVTLDTGVTLVFEGSTANAHETTLTVVDPTADRTITFPDATGTVALTSDIAELSQDAIDLALTAGTGITKNYNDSTNTLTIAVDTTAIQARVANVSDTEIGYLDGVTSGIQTQIDAKAPLASPTFTGTVNAAALTLSGNLTVNGTTTSLASTTLVIEDKNIVLGDIQEPTDTTADGGGITLNGATNKTFNWVNGTNSWTSSEHLNLASGKSLYLNGTLLKDTTETLTNKTLTSPKVNENVAVTATSTELNVLDGITSSTAELNILDGVTATAAELNILDGVTATTAELNILDGVTATTAELNILDGVTATAAQINVLVSLTATVNELNILDGVTATTAELNKLAGVTATSAEINTLSGLTSTAAELNILDGATLSVTELNYVDGVTSAIQTQIDTKAPSASPTFTGTVSLGTGASLVLEGATANDFETTLAVTDPTANRTITFPNATGTVALAEDISISLGGYVETTDIGGVSGVAATDSNRNVITALSVVFEGANENAYETFLTVTEPASDVTISLPNTADTLVGRATTDTLTNKTLTSPNVNEAVALTATSTELNVLDGITSSTAELNILDGVTATTAELNKLAGVTATSAEINTLSGLTSTAAELNILDGATLSVTELNYVDGVTSSIQTQLDAKQAVVANVSDTEIGYLNGVTSDIQTQLNGKQATVLNVSDVEIGYLDGVTSSIQTQIDTKAPSASPTFTGTVTLPSGAVTSTMILDGTILNADINASAAIDWTKLGISSTVSSTEIGYVDGVTSAIQTQLDAKSPLASPTFTGTVNAAALTLSGDLIVNGTTTTINSTTLAVDDKNIVIGDVATPSDVTADGGGITLKGATDKTFNWVDATDSWTSSEHINLASGKDLKVNGTAVISSTAGGFIFTDGTQTLEGVPSRTPILQKTASYTLSALTERDDLIEMASASAMTLTIPLNSAVAFPVGTSIDILQTSTGQVTIAGSVGVTINSTPGLKLRTQWSTATLFKRAENTWVVYGDLTA